MTDLTEIRARRERHDADIESVQWFTPSDLAARWKIAPSTVHAIPLEQLQYKTFGQGTKLKRRRYRADWVAAYEEASGRSAA